jgi:hypothetical protein
LINNALITAVRSAPDAGASMGTGCVAFFNVTAGLVGSVAGPALRRWRSGSRAKREAVSDAESSVRAGG